MNEKSHVSLEQRLCVVCAKSYDTGAILMDCRIRPTLERHTTTGWGLCPEHQKLHDDGFVALVECDREKSGVQDNDQTAKPSEVYRTGPILHLKWELFLRLFEVPFPDKMPPCVFVEQGVMELLKSKVTAKAS